jgi:hypothetical protein
MVHGLKKKKKKKWYERMLGLIRELTSVLMGGLMHSRIEKKLHIKNVVQIITYNSPN